MMKLTSALLATLFALAGAAAHAADAPAKGTAVKAGDKAASASQVGASVTALPCPAVKAGNKAASASQVGARVTASPCTAVKAGDKAASAPSPVASAPAKKKEKKGGC